jgi:glycosyltransferase involved in cell wall biosynthesis
MHITHIITGLNRGGAERALHSILTETPHPSHKTRVVSLTDEGSYGSSLRDSGIPVYCLGMSRGYIDIQAAFGLLRELRSNPPDILQGWMYHGNLAATFASRFLQNKPILAWNIRCGLGSPRDLSALTLTIVRLLRSISKMPNTIIYNSSASRVQHSQSGFFDDNAAVIPNGFNLDVWRPDIVRREDSRCSLKLSRDTKVIGYIGRNHPQKDLSTLFSALRILMSDSCKIHFLVVGSNLEAALPADLPRDRFTFLGERADITEILPAFDFLCLSSKSESFPNVLGEAMALGVPCISTNVGDAARIIGKIGWVVQAESPFALATALRTALAIGSEELAWRRQAARDRIATHFSIGATIDDYFKLYERLLSRQSRCAA